MMIKPTAGVEIGERYLKIAVARPAKGSAYSLEYFVKPTRGLSDEDIAKAVKERLEKSGIKTARLTVCLPRNLVTMRNLHLPSHDPSEIAQMIDLHIGRIVPYKKEEIVFDHMSLRTDSLGYTAQILAIVHRDIIRRYQRIVEAAGLDVDEILLSTYGVWQWVVNKFIAQINRDELYLILDIDSLYTDFIIFSADNIIFSRTLAFEMKDVLANSEINKLIGEIKQSILIFHKNESINKKPSHVFISGARDTNVVDALKKDLEIPVTAVMDPLEESNKIAYDSISHDLSMVAVSQFALGKKTRSLSFALPDMLVKRSLREKTKELTILGITLIYLFMVVMAFFWGRQYNEQFYLKRLMNRNAMIARDIGGLMDRYKEMNFVKNFLYERKAPALLLNELEKAVTAEVTVNYISMEPAGAVAIRGQALKLSDVFKFVTLLENSKYFSDVSTKYTRTKKVKERDITDFEINFAMSLSKR